MIEKSQKYLFEEFKEFDWKEEWKDMPEFIQEDLTPYRTLYVHFKDQDNVDDFMKLIEQKITDKTKYIWYPTVNKINRKSRMYYDES